jgi:flagellar motor switch protein FliN
MAFSFDDHSLKMQKKLPWMSYDGLLDMEVEFVADLAKIELSISEILKLEKGSVIDLKKPTGESMESYVNGTILGRGEIIVYNKNLAIRINEILSSSSLRKHLPKENL